MAQRCESTKASQLYAKADWPDTLKGELIKYAE